MAKNQSHPLLIWLFYFLVAGLVVLPPMIFIGVKLSSKTQASDMGSLQQTVALDAGDWMKGVEAQVGAELERASAEWQEIEARNFFAELNACRRPYVVDPGMMPATPADSAEFLRRMNRCPGEHYCKEGHPLPACALFFRTQCDFVKGKSCREVFPKKFGIEVKRPTNRQPSTK
jgi:hypothetical protein